jgi:hypothetical protein
VFQAQELEVHQKLEIVQQDLFSKVGIIQDYFREMIQSLDNILFREKEANVARTTFQKAVISSAREEVPITPRLTVVEQIRGDIILNAWEANKSKTRKMTKEIKEECEEVFDLLDKKSLGIGKDNCAGVLGKINVVKNKFDIKERLNEAQIEISQLKQVEIAQMDRWMVKKNL